jgi:salicylate hydroxylase
MMGLKIAVVGCGTAGMAAALFLNRDGHDVTLFERFHQPRPLGAGILLQPTGLACLSALGLGEKILSYGAKIRNLYGHTKKGRVIFDIRYADLRPHYFGLGIHRGALFKVLHDEVVARRISIVTGCDVASTALRGNKRCVVDINGDERGAFDLVIDASGARSVLRDENTAMKYNKLYPYGAVWGVCEDEGQSFCTYYLQQRYEGAGIMIGALAIGKRPTDNKDTMAFFWSLPIDSYETWRAAGLDEWKKRVFYHWPELSPFIDQFNSVDDLTFAKYGDTIMRQWHGERMVYIGDSAHCTSPQLGQGANLGLADALTLAGCIREGERLEEVLASYTAARKKHVGFYQIASRWLTPFFQSNINTAAFIRDMTFEIFCKTPYIRSEMLKTLSGIKTGMFTQLDPGEWHPDYAFNKV